MQMIFLFPLVFSVAAVGYFIIVGDYGPITLGIAVLLEAASIAMQFVPALRTHFLIPLFIQLGICIWFLFDRQLNG